MGKISRYPASWVREGDWKLIRLYNANDDQTDRFELYNLREDIGETHDLAAEQPERVKRVERQAGRDFSRNGAVLPKPNPAYDPTVDVEILGWRAAK